MKKMILAEMPVASWCDADILDFDALVHAHARFVLNVAYAVLRNSEDAEDAAQGTFFNAFRSGDLGSAAFGQIHDCQQRGGSRNQALIPGRCDCNETEIMAECSVQSRARKQAGPRWME